MSKAARCVNAAENSIRGDQAVDVESWADIHHAATILEELERDLRSEVLTSIASRPSEGEAQAPDQEKRRSE